MPAADEAEKRGKGLTSKCPRRVAEAGASGNGPCTTPVTPEDDPTRPSAHGAAEGLAGQAGGCWLLLPTEPQGATCHGVAGTTALLSAAHPGTGTHVGGHPAKGSEAAHHTLL